MDEKNIKHIILSVVLAVALTLVFVLVSAANFDTTNKIDLSNYSEENDVVTIQNLFVDVKVTKDNKAYITETFDATFNDSGLSEVIRYIQYSGSTSYVNENGKTVQQKFLLKVEDINGFGDYGEKCNIYTDEETGFITIGLKSETFVPVGETRNFTISYVCCLNNDTNKGFDQFYYNIVGVDSALTIRNVSFSVDLPQEVEAQKDVFVYVGKYGESKQLTTCSVSGNVITGSCDVLGPTEGITIRALFEDNYFAKNIVVSWQAIVCLVAALAALVLAILFIVKYKQKKKLVIPVEVIAPEDLYPSKAEYLHGGKCTSKSLIASLLYLGDKGYIKLNQIELDAKNQNLVDILSKKEDFEIIKLKEIREDEPKSILALYRALFKTEDKVLLSKLDDEFYSSCNAILMAENHKEKASLYKTNSQKKSTNIKSIVLLSSVVLLLFMLFASFSYFEFSAMVYIVHVVFLGAAIIAATILSITKTTSLPYVLAIGVSVIVGAILMYVNAGYVFVDSAYLVLIAIILLVVAIILLCGEPEYKQESFVLKGRVLGFKNFIEKCEVKQIEMFAEETPEYFFKVLPYAYVFGLSNVWIGKFANVSKGVVKWITVNGEEIESLTVITKAMSSFAVMSTAKYNSLSKAARSSSSTGGGFSGGGGGFSGGGMGGGGFGAR